MTNDLIPALLKSSILHAALVGALVVGSLFKSPAPQVLEVTLNTPQASAPSNEKAVEAMTVDQEAVAKRIEELKKQDAAKKAAERKRIRDLERRAENAKKERQKEARRIAKLEKQRKQKELEKKKADAAAKKADEAAKKAQKKQRDAQKKAAADKKKADELAEKRKQEELALKKAEEKRKKDAAIAKKKAEDARKRALEEKQMQDALAAEAAARSKARKAQVLTEVEKYTALITSKIQQNLLIDEKMKGKECRLNIRLAFNGFVTKVNPLGGDKLVCEAAIRAVGMADTLPVSKDKAVFEELKNINLTIQPNV